VLDCEIGICIGNTAQVRVLASRLVNTHTFDDLFVYVFTRFFTHLLFYEITYLRIDLRIDMILMLWCVVVWVLLLIYSLTHLFFYSFILLLIYSFMK